MTLAISFVSSAAHSAAVNAATAAATHSDHWSGGAFCLALIGSGFCGMLIFVLICLIREK